MKLPVWLESKGECEGCHRCAVSLFQASSLTVLGEQPMPSTKADAAGFPIVLFYLTSHDSLPYK